MRDWKIARCDYDIDPDVNGQVAQIEDQVNPTSGGVTY